MHKRIREAAPSTTVLGFLAIAAAAALWAVAAVAARDLFDRGLDPIELTASRSWIAVLGLGVLAWGSKAPAPERGKPLVAIALGLSIALVNTTYYLAIDRLPVAIAIVLQYTAPALVVAWTAIGARRRPAPEVLGAVVASAFGIVLVSELIGADVGSIDGLGILLGLASAVLFAGYTVLSESAGSVYGVQGALFRGFVAASVFWVIVFAFRGWPAGLFEPENIPGVLFVGIGGTLAPFLLYLWGVQQVKAERASIAATLEPVLAAIVAWIWLSQELSGIQIIGGVLVVASVLALQIRRQESRAPEP